MGRHLDYPVARLRAGGPDSQTPYKATACPIKELKGQREHLGGPPVVRVSEAWDQDRDEAFSQSSECQDLVYERTERKVMDVKVAGRAQRCKPRMYRVDTGMKKIADCQERNPQLIPGVSIVALSAGSEGLVAPAVGKRANETRLFRHRTRASLAGTRMLGHGEPEDASTGGSPVSPGSAQATEAQGPGLSSPARLVERRSTKGVIPMAEAEIRYVSDTPREQRGDPGGNTLRKRIIEHEKRTSPRELRRMTEDGTLEEYLATKIRATRRYARDLIGNNEIPTHAWRRAERVYIYEKDED